MSPDNLTDLEKQKNKEQLEAEQRVIDDDNSSVRSVIPERKLTWSVCSNSFAMMRSPLNGPKGCASALCCKGLTVPLVAENLF